jgi:hypothetical protein
MSTTDNTIQYHGRTPDKEVWPNPFMLAWETNVSTSPDLNIEFSTSSNIEQTHRLVENFVLNNRFCHGDGEPTARELRGTPKGLFDKFQPSPGEPQRKRKPRSTIGLFKLLASKRGTVCVLTIWYFRPFCNAGLQSPRDLPSP